jgi:hypothetical protein
MLIMGGFSTEAKVVLDDFNLFDFQTENWLKVRMTKETDGKIFTPNSLSFSSSDAIAIKDNETPCGRKLHKICGVWDQAYYSN